MPHHFTKTTVEASFWCKVCGRDTMHNVADGRRGSCQVCIKRLEDQPKKPPKAVQGGLFGQ